jgi:hypothetical protein
VKVLSNIASQKVRRIGRNTSFTLFPPGLAADFLPRWAQMSESVSKDNALRDILDRLLTEIDDVIALISRPLKTEFSETSSEPSGLELEAPAT